MAIYLVEAVIGFPGKADVTLRWSNGVVAPFPPDDADRPDAWWDPVLLEPPNFTMEMYADFTAGVGGGTVGEVQASNDGGAFSTYRGYAVKSLSVSVGSATAVHFSDFTPILVDGGGGMVAVDPPTSGGSRITLPVSDPRDRLDKPIQETTYAGTNSGAVGYEGTKDDLKGSYKPVALGDLTAGNLPAPSVNASVQTWQPHDGALGVMGAIAAINDGGGATGQTSGGDFSGAAFDAALPDASHYVTDTGRGLIRVGGSRGGAVTIDLHGLVEAGETGPEIIKWLLSRSFGAAALGASFADLSVAALGPLAAAKMGVWTDKTEMTRRSVIDLLARSGGWWVLPDPLGQWQIGLLALPVGNPVAAFDEDDVVELVEGDVGRDVPPYGVEVKWGRIYQILSAAELSGEVRGTARADFLAEEWRTTTAYENAEVKALYGDAELVSLETALYAEADANTLRDLWGALHCVPRLRRTWTAPLDRVSAALTLGAEITLTYAADGLVDHPCRVVGLQPTASAETIVLKLWGALP